MIFFQLALSLMDHTLVLFTIFRTCIFPSTDLLLDCLELCKSTRSAADVYRQCQIEDFGFFTKVSLLNTVYVSTRMPDRLSNDIQPRLELGNMDKNKKKLISISLGWIAIYTIYLSIFYSFLFGLKKVNVTTGCGVYELMCKKRVKITFNSYIIAL